jgi:transposase
VFGSEFDRRFFAVNLVLTEGWTQRNAAAHVGRSDRWLRKWLRRYESDGAEGLRDLPRIPHRQPASTGPQVVARILAKRAELAGEEFASIGAEAIRYELFEEGLDPLPSISTIERTLRRNGVTAPNQRPRRRRGPSFDDIRTPGRYQQLDWVGPRWVGDGQRFSSINLVDVGGGAARARQHFHKSQTNSASFLTDHAWPTCGIPHALSADNEFCWTTHRNHPWTLTVRAGLIFGAEIVITPPREHGWHQHIESFNELFQARTLHRHHYTTYNEFTAASDRFITYFNHRRPHPRLSTTRHGTRYPADLLTCHANTLRYPPDGFRLDTYRNHTGTIRLPIARGRITFLRRVQPDSTINIAQTRWPIPTRYDLENQIVIATIHTASARLDIRYDNEIITRHRYPIPEPVIEPFHQPHHTGLYYHRTGTMS